MTYEFFSKITASSIFSTSYRFDISKLLFVSFINSTNIWFLLLTAMMGKKKRYLIDKTYQPQILFNKKGYEISIAIAIAIAIDFAIDIDIFFFRIIPFDPFG